MNKTEKSLDNWVLNTAQYEGLVEMSPISDNKYSKEHWDKKIKTTLFKVEKLKKQLVRWLGAEMSVLIYTRPGSDEISSRPGSDEAIQSIKETYRKISYELAWFSVKIGLRKDIETNKTIVTLLSKEGVSRCNEIQKIIYNSPGGLKKYE